MHVVTYGKDAERKELAPGGARAHRPLRLPGRGRDARGGRKDVRLVLYYDRIPSLLGLKTWLPDAIQRVFRLRRSTSASC